MYEMVCTINPDAGKVLNLIEIDPTFLIEECRLRDAYLSKDKTKVVIFTRIGGGNRSYHTPAICIFRVSNTSRKITNGSCFFS